jgi:plastocyanin
MQSTLKRMLFVVLVGLALALPHARPAQAVANPQGEVFLKGNFVEVGIAKEGWFGTKQAVPSGAGLHPIRRQSLGFVADFQRDGWTAGNPPQSGDYFLPGGPAQGFDLAWENPSGQTRLKSVRHLSVSLVEIAAVSLVETIPNAEAVWRGNATEGAETVAVTRTISVGTNDLFFRIDVDLENTGSVPLKNVRYNETVDPDNDKDLNGPYETNNAITKQPGLYPTGNSREALIVAKGTVFPVVTLGLGTVDKRAKTAMGGLAADRNDPNAILSAPACRPSNSATCAPQGEVSDDIVIHLSFALGDLAPGQVVKFSYVYVLSENDLDTALASLAALTLDLNGPDSGSGFAVDYPVGSGPKVIVDGDLTLTTSGGNFTGATVTLSPRPDGAAESLDANVGSTGITKSFANGVLTLSGSAPAATYQQVLRTVTYQNTADANGITRGPRTATFVATAGTATSPAVQSTITVPQRGTVRIRPMTNPDSTTQFSFTSSVPGNPSFTLEANQVKDILVESGSYTVTEADPTAAGYALTVLTFSETIAGGTPSTRDLAARTATLNVDAGETVLVEFDNTQLDAVVVERVTAPPGAGGSAAYSDTLGAPNVFNLSTKDTKRLFTGILPGDYTVRQTSAGPGFDLTGIGCYNAANQLLTSGNVSSGIAALTLTPGASIHCIFTNTQRGAIVVNKAVEPAGVGGNFVFTSTVPGSASFDITDTITIANVVPGSYTIREQLNPPVDGFDLSDLTCTDGSATGAASTTDRDARLATVNVDPGETVTCTFTNGKRDTLVVTALSVPTDTVSFAYTTDLGPGFSLPSGGSQVFQNVAPTTHSVTQADPTPLGYTLTGAACSNAFPNTVPLASGFDFATRTVTVTTTAAQQAVSCIFLNQKLGTVVVEKETSPASSAVFSYTASLAAAGVFSLTNGNAVTFTNVVPSVYSVTEFTPTAAGFELGSITCTDSDAAGARSTGDLAARTATVRLDVGETVKCRFTNVELDSLIVQKLTEPTGAPGAFTFTPTGLPGGDFSLLDGGLKVFENVSPQPYTVAEKPATGFDLTELGCIELLANKTTLGDPTQRSVTVQPAPGEVTYCAFGNRQQGTIVVKQATVGGSGAGFAFTSDIPGNAAFTLDTGATKTIANVSAGQYKLNAASTPGFDQTGLVCSDGNAAGTASTAVPNGGVATINVDPGETVTCTFTNTVHGAIVIDNVTLPGGSPAFAYNGDLGPFTVNGGQSKTFANLSPGAYHVVQDDPAALGFELGKIFCNDANSSGKPQSRNALIRVEPGETVTCTFNNAQLDTIVIDAESLPPGGTGFGFTHNIDSVGSFTLNHGQSKTFAEVESNTYTVRLSTLPAGYELTDIVCDGSAGAAPDLANRTVALSLSPGQVAHCTFRLIEDDTIVIEKVTLPGTNSDFAFTQDVDGSGPFVLGNGQTKTFTNVTPGAYTITEADPTALGYSLDSLVCTGAADVAIDRTARRATLTLAPGEAVRCTFTNRANAAGPRGIDLPVIRQP